MGQSVIYQFDQFKLDTGQFQLRRGNTPVRIEPLAFDLLVYLIEHRDRVVGRDELLDALWPGKIVSDSALAARLRDLRKALGDSGQRQKIVKTVHGRGYRFVQSVTESAAVEHTARVAQIVSGEALELPDKPSVAVLPFVSDSDDREDEYFCDGVTDGIIGGLTRYRDLFVMGRSSAFTFRFRPDAIGEAGVRLGVRYVVRGAIRRIGERVRVSIELIDNLTSQTLWGEHYDRDYADLFDVEDEICRVIISALVPEVEDAAYRAAETRPPENIAAYEWVLRGTHSFNRGTVEDLLEARQRYENALELDPKCSAAYTGLSKVYLYLCWGRLGEDYDRLLEQCLRCGEIAVALDDRDSRAHYAIAHAYFCRGQHHLAELHIEKALALNPGEYHNICAKGYLLACTGRHEESATCFLDSLRHNPLAPNSCLFGLGIADYLACRYADAVLMFTRFSGRLTHKFSGLAASQAQLGNLAEARTAVREFDELLDPALVARLGDDTAKWRESWSQLYTILNPDDFEHLLDGLRKAGFRA